MIGQHISHFYILRQLGSGGMGIVYEAQDTRLPRSVAIKFLKSTLSDDVGALKRFQREAQLASSLNHPNICTIYDVDASGGQSFIAMELLRGQSLKSRLAGGPLSLHEIIDIATQVADALGAAHGQGIIHRDIAPGNVFLTESGLVKVLDFGLAKHGVARDSDDATTDNVTAPGTAAGTLPYMAPERLAADAPVDFRCDLYSVGILLYQMATGARPFDVTPDTALVSAIRSQPYVPLRILAPGRPADLERIIDRLLAKQPEHRYQSARALRTDLDALRGGSQTMPSSALHFPEPSAPTASSVRSMRWRSPLPLVIGAGATAGVAIVVYLLMRGPPAPVETAFIRHDNLIDQAVTSSVTITPSGGALVYTGSAESAKPIMFLPLDQEIARAIPGTEGATRPQVSADGRRLAIFSDPKFEIVSLDGVATPRAANGWKYGNGLWITDSTYVSEDPVTRGLTRSVFGGGDRGALTRVDTAHGESRHQAAFILPGGRAVVFTVNTLGGPRAVGPLAIASLDPNERFSPHTWLGVEARRAFAFVNDWLLYTSTDGSAINAVRLDVKRRRISGTPITVLREAKGNLETATLADNGTLLYVRQPRFNTPVLVDSTGTVRWQLTSAGETFMYPRLSPDSRRIVIQKLNPTGGNDVWIYDTRSRTPTPLTINRKALQPSWTPDGRRIVFFTAGTRVLMSQRLDGGAAAEELPDTKGAFAPTVAPDGRVVFQRHEHNGAWNVWTASLTGRSAPSPALHDSLVHYMPAISPDGHWMADVSSVTGRNEVYVRPFPGPGSAVLVSESGGVEPAWSPDSRRIYYRINGAFMEARITTSPKLEVTSHRRLFADAFDGAMDHRNYDVAPDGSGFLMITGGSSEAVVMLNWLSKLKTRLSRER